METKKGSENAFADVVVALFEGLLVFAVQILIFPMYIVTGLYLSAAEIAKQAREMNR